MKRMIGIVIGVFCILVVEGLCLICFNMDLKWWIALNKPAFVLPGGWFTLLVCVAYLSSILSISRIVERKRFFPSMAIFLIVGVFAILFVLAFFTLKNLLFGFVCISLTFGASFCLFMRFVVKDWVTALMYLPSFSFNFYAYLCVLSILMCN